MFNFEKFPVIQTERLKLREIIADDVSAIFDIRGDYEVTKYNFGAAYTELEQAQELIDQMTTSYSEERSVRWGITRQPDDTVIGMCGFNYWDRTDHRGSIGFDLNRKYWRQGIMREALKTVIRFGFQAMQLNRIEADASIYNSRSLALLKSLNFQQEGIQREQYYEDNAYHDLVLLALLRHDWEG